MIDWRDPVTWLFGGAAVCFGFAALWALALGIATVLGV